MRTLGAQADDISIDDAVTSGDATAIECENSLLRSDSENLEVVGIGLKNVMAIAMSDAVLVADMSRAQEVKKAVAALKAKGSAQATVICRRHRCLGRPFGVKGRDEVLQNTILMT